MTVTATIRVPRETRDRLAARARERGVSLSSLLTEFARRAERLDALRSERQATRADAGNPDLTAEERIDQRPIGTASPPCRFSPRHGLSAAKPASAGAPAQLARSSPCRISVAALAEASRVIGPRFAVGAHQDPSSQRTIWARQGSRFGVDLCSNYAKLVGGARFLGPSAGSRRGSCGRRKSRPDASSRLS